MGDVREYSGWSNWETFNVGTWISNDEGLYNLASGYNCYEEFASLMAVLHSEGTPDGVDWLDPVLDTDELDELFE